MKSLKRYQIKIKFQIKNLQIKQVYKILVKKWKTIKKSMKKKERI
jgi:hypothetical protein